MNEKQLINLVKGARQKDNAAMEELFKTYYGEVLFICKKYNLNEADAADVAQETFIKAFKEINTLENPAKFPKWLSRIASNKCLDLLKHNKTLTMDTVSSEELELDIPDKGRSSEEIVLDNEVREIIAQMLAKLPIEQRVTVFMYYYQDYSIKEIAQAYGCSENTVKSRLSYAKKAMRQEAEQLENKGVKLRTVAALPFLYLFFAGEREVFACEIPDCVNVISHVMGSIAKNSLPTVPATAKSGFFATVAGKIAVGAAALAVMAGGVVACVSVSNNDDADKTDGNNISANITPDGNNINMNTEESTAERETYYDWTGVFTETMYDHDINYINEAAIENGNLTFVLRKGNPFLEIPSLDDCYMVTVSYEGKKAEDYFSQINGEYGDYVDFGFYDSGYSNYSFDEMYAGEGTIAIVDGEFQHTFHLSVEEESDCDSVEEYAKLRAEAHSEKYTELYTGYVGDFYLSVTEHEDRYYCGAYKWFDSEHIIMVKMYEDKEPIMDKFNSDYMDIFKSVMESLSIEYIGSINNLQGTDKAVVYDCIAKLLSEKYPIYLKDYSKISSIEFDTICYETEECKYELIADSIYELTECMDGEYELIVSLGDGIELYYCNGIAESVVDTQHADGFVVVNNNLGCMVKAVMDTDVQDVEERLEMFRRDLFK